MQNSNRKNSRSSRKYSQRNDAQAFYNDQLGENPEEGRMRKEYYKSKGKRGK
jgi:hypothetical protein